MIFLTDILINEIKKFDHEIAGTNPKDCMFRIFRDVRFSKNKQPYKTNFGSFIENTIQTFRELHKANVLLHEALEK